MAKKDDDFPIFFVGGGLLAALLLLSPSKAEAAKEIKAPDNTTPPPAQNNDADQEFQPSPPKSQTTTPPPPASSSQQTYSGATDYVKKNWSQAKDVTARTKVPTLTIIAHSGIESAWGKHAPGNNFFGIMAGKAWTGRKQRLKTFECGKTGNAKTDKITAEIVSIHAPGTTGSHAGCNKKNYYTYRTYSYFRMYDTPRDSFNDYANFLIKNTRYADAFKYVNDPKKFAVTIMQKGYGTAPAYQELIQKIIDQVQAIAVKEGLV